MQSNRLGICFLVAFFSTTTLNAAHAADPPTNNGQNLQTWTSSDRFALIGCLVIGLGAGLGGTASYIDAKDKIAKADADEKKIEASTGKSCPNASGCADVAKMRDDAETSEHGAIAGMVIGGLLLGVLTPMVIYSGFQPKKPSAPNLMMKIQPVFAPGQTGFVMAGRF